MATAISDTATSNAALRHTGVAAGRTRSPRRGGCRLALALVALAAAGGALGDDVQRVFAARAEQAFREARQRFFTATNDVTAAWQLGRRAFDWAEFAPGDREREDIANTGIAACRHAVAQDPRSAAAHFYLGVNLGQLARTKVLGALKIVREMERTFKTAADLDPTFNYAGPDRCLGLLYLEAPGWPTSIGSRAKARRHLERAVELSPAYPENLLNLAEANLRWGDRKGLARDMERLGVLLPEARKTLAGEAWEGNWRDWEASWTNLVLKARSLDR